MNVKKQRELLEYLISSPDTFSLCYSIIEYDYFDYSLQSSVQYILDYYEKYNGLPRPSMIEAETELELKKFKIKPHEVAATVSEIEQFCKQMAIQQAVIAAVPLIEQGDYDAVEESIKAAVMVSVQADLGIAYFDTVEERLERLKHGNEILPTKWNKFNEKLFGGPARKELLLFAAGSGGGKSITLSNLGLDYADLGYNVLYISLELSQDIVSQRFDSMITGIGRKDWLDHIPEIINGVKSYKNDSTGRLDVLYMKSETKCNEIRAYLKNYEMHFDTKPDIILVDYLDKLAPNSKVTGNAFDVDKKISEQLRQIGVDYNAAIITASQLNRSAVGEDVQNHSMIAGGISKINEADTFVTLFMNEVMKADERIDMSFQKTRNSDGVGSRIHMKFEAKTLKITDGPDDLNTELKLPAGKAANKKNREDIESGKGSDLLSLFDNE